MNQRLEEDYKIIKKCYKILKLCAENFPLTDNQMQGLTEEMIKIGESQNGKSNEKFARNIALAFLDEIERLDKNG